MNAIQKCTGLDVLRGKEYKSKHPVVDSAEIIGNYEEEQYLHLELLQ
jgi:hypothetical protein